MSKFNRRSTLPAQSPIITTGQARTFEGGAAFRRDIRSELLMLAVTNMAGEDTFYEKADARDGRYRDLVHAVAVQDPAWMVEFVRWLRLNANMRSASLVAAAETVYARTKAGLPGYGRAIVNAALQRPDEPGELLGYWANRYGRAFPLPLKKGIADATRRLYDEGPVLKYDTSSHPWRFADVLELTHPAPKPPPGYFDDLTDEALTRDELDVKVRAELDRRRQLYKHVINRRHGRRERVPDRLTVIRANERLRAEAFHDPHVLLDSERLRAAGMTWEDVLSLAGDRLPKAKVWAAIAPSMGVMALIRNLRNIDEANVPDAVAEEIVRRIADPGVIAKSRLFPYRFLSAYRAAPSLRWGHALDKALTASCANVPKLDGRTLVLVDTSASMTGSVSARSRVRHVDIGALFAVVLAMRGADVDLVGYADGVFAHPILRGSSALVEIERFCHRIGVVGHGTETVAALQAAYRGQDRVVIVSDMQAFHHAGRGARGYYDHMGRVRGMSVSDAIPAHVPMFGINTSGYAPTSIDTGAPHRYEIGGFSDKMFTMLDLLSRGRDAGWPWETNRGAVAA